MDARRTRRDTRSEDDNSIRRRGHESHNPCSIDGRRQGVALALTAGAGAATRETGSGPRWTITDLGTFGARWTSGSAAAVNARGQVVGTNGTAEGKQHAFLWQNGKMRDLGTLGGRDSGASAINASGQVIGTSLTSKPQHVHAFIWKDGKMTDLGTLGGKSSRPRALNDRGQVVGESFTASGMVHAFLWQNGKMTDLGTLGGSDSFASGINDRGQVVGSSSTSNGSQHAFLWQSGKMTDLGTLGAHFTSSSATAINGRGQVVGTSYLAKVTQTGQQGHAFVWQNGVMTDLGTLGAGYATSEAVALNERGVVVGSSRSATGSARPVLWRDRMIRAALSRFHVRRGRRDQRSRPGDRRARSGGRSGRARIHLGERYAHRPRHARRCRKRRSRNQRAESDRGCQQHTTRRSAPRSLDDDSELKVGGRASQSRRALPNRRGVAHDRTFANTANVTIRDGRRPLRGRVSFYLGQPALGADTGRSPAVRVRVCRPEGWAYQRRVSGKPQTSRRQLFSTERQKPRAVAAPANAPPRSNEKGISEFVPTSGRASFATASLWSGHRRRPDVDFTVRSAALAREFTDSHEVPADIRELVANAIAMHYTPGVGLESGAEAYLLSAGAAVDVFGLRSNEIPDAVRQSVIQEYPRLGFKREFAGLLRAEAKQVPRGRAWYLHRFALSDLSIRLAPFRG